MKKIAGVFAVISVIILLFCSCFDGLNNDANSVNTTQATTIAKTDIDEYTDKYTAVKLTYGYDGLNNNFQRDCYNKIAEKSSAITGEKSDSGCYLSEEIDLLSNTPERDIFIALTAYKYDNPGEFWLDDSFLTTTYNDKVVLELMSYYSSEELVQHKTTFDNKVTEILGSMEKGLSEYGRELYIHDYLINNCQYDDDVLNTSATNIADYNFESYTSLGALINGKAVCQGYTEAMSYLLSCVGIKNTSVSGVGQQENHIWNAVEIDGDWYYLDVTWDDNNGEAFMYDYFNLTTEQLENDHIIGKKYADISDEEITGGDNGLGCNFNIYIPQCNSDEYNYYVQDGAVLTGFTGEDDYQMGQDLLEVAENHGTYYHIYIDPDYLDFTYASNKLFDAYLYNYKYYVDIANDSLTDYNIDYAASIVKKEKLNVITVEITYN